jgi:hypothetical protein
VANHGQDTNTCLILFQTLTAGLSWDLIALQDIEPGQEVSVTYSSVSDLCLVSTVYIQYVA